VSFALFGDNTVTATKTKKKKKTLRARIGDLAIIKFDDSTVVGIVTEWDCCDLYRFIYSQRRGSRVEVLSGTLPRCRLTRARPKMLWKGSLSELTPDLVEPILEGE
jgi:hypothetical protein